MMKHNGSNQLFVLVVVIGIILVACSPKPTEAPVEAPSHGDSSGEAWTAEEDITIPEGGGLPNLTIPAGTEVTPKSAKGKQGIEEISPSEIGSSLPALPEGKKVIAAVDVTPDGQTFRPPVPVEIPLPSGHGYSAGDILEMMQLDKGSDKWLPAGEAEVDSSEKFAVGEIAHTSVFALVESGGFTLIDPNDINSVLEWTTYAALSDDVSAIADVIPETGVAYAYPEGPEWKSDTYMLEDIDNLFDDVICLGLLDDRTIAFAEREDEYTQYMFSFHQEESGWQLKSIALMAGPRAYPIDGFSPCPDTPR